MYKLIISILALSLSISSNATNYTNPFIVDANTTYLMETCSFLDDADTTYYLEKRPHSRNFDNYVSIVDNNKERIKIEFNDSSKMFQDLSMAVVSNGKVYYKDLENQRKEKNDLYFGLCKGSIDKNIKRVNKETLKCFSEKSFISKNKDKKEILFKKNRDFKVKINYDKNNEAYFILEQEVYIPGKKIKEKDMNVFYQLCKKPIEFNKY